MPLAIRRALLSVSDKTGLAALGTALQGHGVELVASGGTAKALRDAGCTVTEVSDYTGAPEILGGRVKTLHPKIHGGILARRDNPLHAADLAREAMGPIDLVVVNLYPFEATIAKPGVTRAEAIEQIDIGGPTLLRAAAKNYHDVVAICDPADYDALLDQLQASQCTISAPFALAMAQKVFARIAHYDAMISNYFHMHNVIARSEQSERRGNLVFPHLWSAQYAQIQSLRYGENPHQEAAWYQTVGESPWIGTPLQGKPLSYNNLLDIDAAVRIVRELHAYPHAVAIVKHGNPCGVGISDVSLAEAFDRAKAGDPVSAFGGIVALGRAMDAATADHVCETFFEVICAPAFSAEVRAIFAHKKNLRLVPFDSQPTDTLVVRSACGGHLIQQVDAAVEDPNAWKVVTKRVPTSAQLKALDLAWRVCKHVRSNAIVFGGEHSTIGIGAGQMSRIDAVRLASDKCGDRKALVAASDAFFPFRDGLDAIAEAGMEAVVQPGGSVRDAEVIAAANEHHMAMLFTGIRHFRH